jgi:hypothetical protein
MGTVFRCKISSFQCDIPPLIDIHKSGQIKAIDEGAMFYGTNWYKRDFIFFTCFDVD